MKCVSPYQFFLAKCSHFPSIYKLTKAFKRLIKAGSAFKVTLSLENIPQEISVLFKTGLLSHLLPFLSTTTLTGTCISVKNKQFASSFTLRIFDKHGDADRTFFLFSPFLIRISRIKRFKQNFTKTFKSKLYFLNKTSQKKMLMLSI